RNPPIHKSTAIRQPQRNATTLNSGAGEKIRDASAKHQRVSVHMHIPRSTLFNAPDASRHSKAHNLTNNSLNGKHPLANAHPKYKRPTTRANAQNYFMWRARTSQQLRIPPAESLVKQCVSRSLTSNEELGIANMR